MSDGGPECVGRVGVIVIGAAFMHSHLSMITATLTICSKRKVLRSAYEHTCITRGLPIETELRSAYMRVSLYVVS